MQKVVYGIGIAIMLLIVVGLALPRQTLVTVESQIDAHPATVFALVNDFRRVTVWSPWIDTDPNVQISYSGAPRGVGATMTWSSTNIGSGTQTITESRPFEHVASVTNPGEPAQARSWIGLQGGDGTTMTTWGFETDHGYNLVARYFSLVLRNVVRRDYENGLGRLKELAESLPGADFGDLEIEHVVLEESEIAYLSIKAARDPGAVSEALGDAYFEILGFIDKHDLQVAGAPVSIKRSFSGSEMLFDAAIPVRGSTDQTPRSGAGVKISSLYTGQAIRAEHVGSYQSLGDTHQKIAAYLAALGIERNGSEWESYVSDPTKVPEEKLLTYVYYPVRAPR